MGWHASVRLHAQNCAARYADAQEPYSLIRIDHSTFDDASRLADALKDADAILHFAGMNRGTEQEVEAANPAIARKLVSACVTAKIAPHIIYANSTHAEHDTFYGRSKRLAADILEESAVGGFTNVILPHIFGECARPYYNNVTATLIDQIWNDQKPEINPHGRVQLLHAGTAAQIAIDAVHAGARGLIQPKGHDISVANLHGKLVGFHEQYSENVFPDLSDSFELALFNSYRAGGFPKHYPIKLHSNSDHRGVLFEVAKGGNSAQSFISSTRPGKKRGDHFHLDLVERFLVVKGEAIIRIRRVLTDEVYEFYVSGDRPEAIDMPPLHTHNIENIGNEDALTFFWAHHLFDPSNPDTYADAV